MARLDLIQLLARCAARYSFSTAVRLQETDDSRVSWFYVTGAVTGTQGSTGGLVGYVNIQGDFKRAYWDTTTSGITNLSQGVGNVSNETGIKGLSNTQLQSSLPKGFSPTIWGENASLNGGLPYLLAVPPAR